MMDDFAEFSKLVLVIIGITLLVSALVFGIVVLAAIPAKNVYNREFGTNYSAVEWALADDVIKSFVHKGEQRVFNVNLSGEVE